MHIFMILKCAPTITTVSVHIYIYISDVSTYIKHVEQIDSMGT